ncbi:hypothetical protein [Aquimarina sp. SS2-1]|uniref:hypothetical protein n=1 Tax=Aquimarina besae TaxID=3342247 RepID=UPI0036710655
MKKRGQKLSLDKIKIARLNNMKEISGGLYGATVVYIDTETNLVSNCTINPTAIPTTSTKTLPIGTTGTGVDTRDL